MQKAAAHSLSGEPRPPVIHVEIPATPSGGKGWLLDDKGLFVLERGPGTFITCACTHAGAGGLEFIDGIPDEFGYFPNTNDAPEDEPAFDSPPDVLERWGKRNGRVFYRASPTVMGSWMLNAGFHNGLTIRASGGHQSTLAIATMVWTPFRARNA